MTVFRDIKKATSGGLEVAHVADLYHEVLKLSEGKTKPGHDVVIVIPAAEFADAGAAEAIALSRSWVW